MTTIVVLLLGVIVIWHRPVLGYVLFMFSETPLVNVMELYGGRILGPSWIILATILLLLRKPRRPNSTDLDVAKCCTLAMSLVILLRQPELAVYDGLARPILVVCDVIVWGPLFLAIDRLSDNEMASLRFWMGMAGIIIGTWGTLIYLTGNDYLTRTAVFQGGEAAASSMSGDAERIVARRFFVMGIFSVIPYAYWYVLRGALTQDRQHWLWNAVMYAGVVAILIATGISVTRSLLLIVGIGSAVMLVSSILVMGKNRRYRNRFVITLAIGGCLLGMVLLRSNLTTIVEQCQSRFSTLGSDDTTVRSRLETNAAAWAYLSEELCPWGAPGPDPFANFPGSGDTTLSLHLWLYYGLPGMMLVMVLFASAFWRLYQCWLARCRDPEQQLIRNMLTAWCVSYTYAWIVGCGLTAPEVLFMILFISEINRLHRACMATANCRLRRTTTWIPLLKSAC